MEKFKNKDHVEIDTPLESILNFIFENSNEMVIILDNDLNYEWINEKYHLKILHYSKKDLIGKNLFSIIHPNDKTYEIDVILEMFQKDGIFLEARIMDKKGEYIWFEIAGNKFISSKKEEKYFVMGKNINKRKEALKKLVESEKRHKLITENTNDLIAIINTNYKFEFLNKTAREISGFSENKIVGRDIFKFIHPEDIEKALLSLKKGLEVGHAKTTVRMISKNGEIRWMEIDGKLIKDYDNVYKGLMVGKDVTEQKEMQEKLIQSEEKYHTIFDESPHAMIVLNTNGEIVDMNRRVTEISGYEDIDLRGENFTTLYNAIPKEYIKLLARRFKQILKHGKVDPEEIQLKKVDGRRLHVRISGHIIKIENQTFIHVLLEDINEIKVKLLNSERQINSLRNKNKDLIDKNKTLKANIKELKKAK